MPKRRRLPGAAARVRAASAASRRRDRFEAAGFRDERIARARGGVRALQRRAPVHERAGAYGALAVKVFEEAGAPGRA